jgi:DNA-binding transcriptional regulator YdaS (Cro superfamily)
MEQALDRAIKLAGGQAALARYIGLSPTAVWAWTRKQKRVPAEYVLKVEAASGVSRHELRPDIYPVAA